MFGGRATKTYTINNPHYAINIDVEIAALRTPGPDDETTKLQIDGSTYGEFDIMESGISWDVFPPEAVYRLQPCDGTLAYVGQQEYADINVPGAISVVIPHTQNTAILSFFDNFDQVPNNEAWGLQNLYFNIMTCDSSCKTCSGPNRIDCDSCPTGTSNILSQCYCNNNPSAQYFHQHQCVSSCPFGFTIDYFNGQCIEDCPQNCLTCSNTICTECQNGFFYMQNENECVDNCPFYAPEVGKICTDPIVPTLTRPKILYQGLSNNIFNSQEVEQDGWVFNSLLSYTYNGTAYQQTNYAPLRCLGQSLAGGQGITRKNNCPSGGCKMSKTFTDMPPHYEVRVKYVFYRGDDWNGDTYRLDIDGTPVFTQTYIAITSAGIASPRCGSYNNIPWANIDTQIDQSVSHNLETLTVSIVWDTDDHSYKKWGAFREVQVVIQQCLEVCGSCDNANDCLTCNESRTNQPSCDQPSPGYYDDGLGNTIFSRCDYQCLECLGSPDNCTVCRFTTDPSYLPNCNKPADCGLYAKVESAGQNHGNTFELLLNDVNQNIPLQTGIHIVRLDSATGSIIENRVFDSSNDYTQNQEIINYIDSIPVNDIVISGIQGDGQQQIHQLTQEKLKLIGWEFNKNLGFQDSFAVIGDKQASNYVSTDQRHVIATHNYSSKIEKCLLSCIQVMSKCLECSGDSSCTKCEDGWFVNNNQCHLCPYPCTKCSEGPLYCTECVSANVTLSNCKECNNNQTCQTCIDNWYVNPSGKCQQCQYPCQNCVGPLTCTLCQTPSNRGSDQGCTCNDGYFDNGSFCEQCDHRKCATCSSSSTICVKQCPANCAVCNASGQCINCNIGYYASPCQQCDHKCAFCDQSTGNCKICKRETGIINNILLNCPCKEGYYYGHNSCMKCSNQCKLCDSTGQCLQCQYSYLLLPTCKMADNGVLPIVKNGKIVELIPCHHKCLKCIKSIDNCTQCKMGLNRENKLPCNCIPGYYDDSKNNCQKCQHVCYTCNDAFTCTSCKEDQSLELNPYNQQCECKLGFKYDQQTKTCRRCFSFMGKCMLICPQNTRQNILEYICSENYVMEDHIVLIWICTFCFLVIVLSSYFLGLTTTQYKMGPLLQKDPYHQQV